MLSGAIEEKRRRQRIVRLSIFETRFVMVPTTEDLYEDDENTDTEVCIPLTERRDYFSMLEITVKSDPRHIHDLVKQMRTYFLDLRLDQETVEDLVLLIDEAVTNTAEHAHEYDRSKNVEIKITVKPTKIQILVKGLLKHEIVNHLRFIEFLKRLIQEDIITARKAQEFLREFVSQELMTAEKAAELSMEFQACSDHHDISDINLLIDDLLDERGRGIILIKELTDGKTKLDIIGQTLTFVMTKNLKRVNNAA